MQCYVLNIVSCRDFMAHLGFKDVLPPLEPAAETAADADTVAESMNDVSIAQPSAPPALPDGDADEDFFNEGIQCLSPMLTDLPFAYPFC